MDNEINDLSQFGFIPGMGLNKEQLREEYIQEQIKIKTFFNLDKLILLGAEESFSWKLYQLEKIFIDKISYAAHTMECDSIRTNGNLASVIQDITGYIINPVQVGKINTEGKIYPMGNIEDIQLFVDPYMRWDDNRIIFMKGDEIMYEGDVVDTHGVFI